MRYPLLSSQYSHGDLNYVKRVKNIELLLLKIGPESNNKRFRSLE